MSYQSVFADYLQRVNVAKNYRSKELRISMEDADALGTAMSLSLVRIVDLQTQVLDLQKQLSNSAGSVTVVGGSFK